MVVKSIAELKKAMMNLVKDSMDENKDWLIQETKDKVDEVVYDIYDPVRYFRTNYLKDSIDIINDKQSSRRYSITVGHNLDNRDWFSIGEFTINYVPQIVTYGKYGTFIGMAYDQFGNYTPHDTTPKGSYSRPRPYMDKTVEELKSNNKYLHQIVNSINANGGKAIIG